MDNRTKAQKAVWEVFRRAFKPRTRLDHAQWSDRFVYLDERFTNRPGRYKVGFTPYMHQIYLWAGDPRVNELTFAKSRQVGGTTYLANVMMCNIVEDPGPAQYVTSTEKNAQSFSEREWEPRVRACRPLVEVLPDDPDDFKKLEQHFKTCTLKLNGAQSPNNLMSRATRYLYEDEIDTWPDDNGDQAPAITTLEACTLSYAHLRKIFRISTPTTPSKPIWRYYLKGSQHKYLVHCPYCGEDEEPFELRFDMLDFHGDREVWGEAATRTEEGEWNLDAVKLKTTLKCPVCTKHIDQRDQTWMVNHGTWRAFNPEAPSNHISCHISALYSSTVTWGDVAVAFLQSHATAGGLHDFYNHWLGLPFERRASEATLEQVDLLVRTTEPRYEMDRAHSKCPVEAALILMEVDVQQDHFWWEQAAVMPNEDSYLLDYGKVFSFADLDQLLTRCYLLPSGERMGIYRALIDSGYRAKREGGVYEHVLQSAGRYYPCQGRAEAHGLFQPIRETLFTHKGQDIEAVQFRDDLFKEELYIRRIQERSGPRFGLPLKLPRDYRLQLTNEKLSEEVQNDGRIKMKWVVKGPNHLGDCAKMRLVGIALVADYLRELRAQQEAQAPPDPALETLKRGLAMDAVLRRSADPAQTEDEEPPPLREESGMRVLVEF